MLVHLLAEGRTETLVARRLLPHCGHTLGTVYGERGCNYVQEKAPFFLHYATQDAGLLVLTDFRDAQEKCIRKALERYLLDRVSSPPPTCLLCFAVREMESWLLADRDSMASFLRVKPNLLPTHPENEVYPKKKLVEIAGKSASRKIREEIGLARNKSSGTGPLYTARIEEFAEKHWCIETAMAGAPSLERCVRHLRELSATCLT